MSVIVRTSLVDTGSSVCLKVHSNSCALLWCCVLAHSSTFIFRHLGSPQSWRVNFRSNLRTFNNECNGLYGSIPSTYKRSCYLRSRIFLLFLPLLKMGIICILYPPIRVIIEVNSVWPWDGHLWIIHFELLSSEIHLELDIWMNCLAYLLLSISTSEICIQEGWLCRTTQISDKATLDKQWHSGRDERSW